MKFFKLSDALNGTNLRQKWKKFTSGFTLVELVIVIAILAILAGVGTLGYSGYIKYAKRAADYELLSAVNTAFHSACMDMGLSAYPEKDKASATLEGESGSKKITNIAVEPTLDGFYDKFKTYFEGNDEHIFTVFESLGYDPALGGFFGILSDGTIALENGWKMKAEAGEDGYTNYIVTDEEGNEYTFTVKDESVAALNDSVFGAMGAANVVGRVGDCASGAAATFGKLPANMLLNTETFQKFNEYISQHNLTKETDDYNTAIANFAVMDVAGLSKDMTVSQAIEVIQGKKSLGTANLGKTVAKAATAYGVLTAWAHDPDHKDDMLANGQTAEQYWNYLAEGLKDEGQLSTIRGEVATNLARNLANSGTFETYVTSSEGQKAIEAYIGAMGTLYENTSTLSDFGVYAKGFGNDDLGAILSGVYGEANP